MAEEKTEASEKTEAPKKSELVATTDIRWFHPPGQIATGRVLQQRWADGDKSEWRDVPIDDKE